MGQILTTRKQLANEAGINRRSQAILKAKAVAYLKLGKGGKLVPLYPVSLAKEITRRVMRKEFAPSQPIDMTDPDTREAVAYYQRAISEAKQRLAASHSTPQTPKALTKHTNELMKSELSITDRETLKSEVGTQRANLGDAEFQRALNIALAKYTGDNQKLAVETLDEIDAHREKFTNGSVTGSTEFWKQVAADSNEAAKRELLAGSAELAEVTRLESEAEAAVSRAKSKAAELNAVYTEFNSIPAKAERLNLRLEAVKTELGGLDSDKLAASFKQACREIQNGARADHVPHSVLASTVATAGLRREVLSEMTSEIERELSNLRNRSKVLAKKLGQKSNI